MKVGIVGTGFIVKEVLPHFKSWEIDARALCSTPRSKSVMEEMCKEFAIEEGFTDYDEMLSTANIDTVYVALPNALHYEYTKKALLAGKHVILEKPMATNDRQAGELANLAKEKGLFLFEAITTLYLPNYGKVREWLPLIGTIKIVTCNYSQYSSRYDAFMQGDIKPAFDPKQAGGALMDLNLYNVQYIVGLFGEPKELLYQPNIERGIDTSGILTMNYGDFMAVAIGAKDCGAPTNNVIQGTKGYILSTTPAGQCTSVSLHLNDGTEETYANTPEHRMEPEFLYFKKAIDSGDTTECYKNLEHSLKVASVLTRARKSAQIVFPGDE